MVKKLFFCAFFALFLLSLFCSCSGEKAEKYADNVTCRSITEAVEKAVTVDSGYAIYGENQIDLMLSTAEKPSDSSIIYSLLSEDINEFGVFKASDEKEAKRIFEDCENYLETMKDEQSAFIASYAPNELPKLQKAEVRRFGNYVAVAILSDSDRQKAFETVENMLK